MQRVAASEKVPIVFIGCKEGLYSFVEAISKAIVAKRGAESNEERDWVITLEPIPNPAENIITLYKEYRHRLKLLRAA